MRTVTRSDHAWAGVVGASASVDDGLALRLPVPLTPLADSSASAVTHAQPHVWTATGLERQVFLDHTGRRHRRVRFAGTGLALLSAAWLGAIVSGGVGFNSLPALPGPAGSLAAAPHVAKHRAVRVAAATTDRPAIRRNAG